MNHEEAKAIVLRIVCDVDYDIYKSLVTETAEDPEWAEEKLNRLATVLQQEVDHALSDCCK